MRSLRRPATTRLLGAIGLVGVMAAAGFARVGLWQIAALVLAAGGLLALTERSRARARAQSSYLLSSLHLHEDGPRAAARPAVPEPIVATQARPDPADIDGEPGRPPLYESVAQRRIDPQADGASVSAPETHPVRPAAENQWNLWELDRLAQQQATNNDEIAFLLFYLRGFADPQGLLPTDFEPLVRETFGNLLATPAA